MLYSIDAVLILGCGGREISGISVCSQTTNVILDLNRIEEKLYEFLDNGCQLFEQPILDWNKIMNVVKTLQSKYNILNDKQWDGIQVWIMQHKKCGAYLRLCTKEDYEEIKEREEFQVIKKNKISPLRSVNEQPEPRPTTTGIEAKA